MITQLNAISTYVLPFVALEATGRAAIAYRKQAPLHKDIALATLTGGCLIMRVQPLSAATLVALTIYAYLQRESGPYITLKILNNTAFGLKRWVISIVPSGISALIESIKGIVKAVFRHIIGGSIKVFAQDILWGNLQIIWKEIVFPGLQSKYRIPVAGALAVSAVILANSAFPLLLYAGSSLWKGCASFVHK